MFARVSAFLSIAVALLFVCDEALAKMGPAQKKFNKLREKVQSQLVNAAEEKERELKEEDAKTGLGDYCAQGLLSEVTYEFNNQTYYRPSFFEGCADNLVLNATNMLLHVNSVNDIFSLYHCFYDLAKDPAKSDPMSYQPELGNTIFGVGGGELDLNAGLEAIMTEVSKKGASLATFWAIHTLFKKLYDGHVKLPTVEQDFYSYDMFAIPQRVLLASEWDVNPTFDLGEDQKLNMTLVFKNSSDPNVNQTLVVESLDGTSVQEFIVGLANNPAVGMFPQSTGGRVNKLLTYDAGFYPSSLFLSTRPSDVMPDSFEVKYTDGSKETFVTLLIPRGPFAEWEEPFTVDGKDYLGILAAPAEEFINQPGTQFDTFQRAISDLAAAGSTRRMLSFDQNKPRKLQDDTTEPFFLNMTLDENVAVFKMQTFEFGDVPDILAVLDAWLALVETATASGQTKLIIDLSKNPGGSTLLAYSFLWALFPNVDLTWYLNQWDINYNNLMRLFVEGLGPLYESLIGLDTSSGEAVVEEFQASMDNFTQADLEVFQIAADAMAELCSGGGDPFYCAQVESLAANVTAFVENPNLADFLNMLDALAVTFEIYNPFSAVEHNLNRTQGIIDGGPVTVLRGGVESNITTRYNAAVDEDTMSYFHELVLNNTMDIPFDEYIFISDGTSASSGAITPFLSRGLYKNRNRTGIIPKVKLLGYGGTGNAEDLTISSVPASVEIALHLEDPIIGDAALQMLISALPSTLNNSAEMQKRAEEYSDSVPIPPYFGNSLPNMPVRNLYDLTMDPGALPLQFVHIPLDEYLPKIYTRVTIEDPEDLEPLYRDVATYFDGIGGGEPSSVSGSTQGSFVVSQIRVDPQWCLTVTQAGDFETAGFALCDFVSMPTNQVFMFQDGKMISSIDTNASKCLQAELGGSSSLVGGELVGIGSCSDDVLTSWTYDSKTEFIHPVGNSTLCLTNRGSSPDLSDTMHVKVCHDRGDYKWTFVSTTE